MEPIRVVETTVAAYEWDALAAEAQAVARRAHRLAIVLAVVLSLGVALAGWTLLPRGARFPTLIWTPVVGVLLFYALRSWLTRRGLREPVARVGRLVVPALVERIGPDQLVGLLRHGGALEVQSSTIIAVQRRDGLVALVASQYNPEELPSFGVPSGGFGP